MAPCFAPRCGPSAGYPRAGASTWWVTSRGPKTRPSRVKGSPNRSVADVAGVSALICGSVPPLTRAAPAPIRVICEAEAGDVVSRRGSVDGGHEVGGRAAAGRITGGVWVVGPAGDSDHEVAAEGPGHAGRDGAPGGAARVARVRAWAGHGDEAAGDEALGRGVGAVGVGCGAGVEEALVSVIGPVVAAGA